MQRLSLAQQIAQLEDVAPADFDPEDVEVTGALPDPDIDIIPDNSAPRAHYFDVGPSTLRKLHESLSDPKYDGERTSRTLMLDDAGSSRSDPASEDEESGSESDTHNSDRESGIMHEVVTRTTTDTSTERPATPEHNGDLLNLRRVREEDRKKGKAISRQIALWDSLLDARIRLQKSVTTGNRLPLLPRDAADQHVYAPLVKMLEEARLLSNEILDFQEHLLSVNESVQPPPRKRQRNTESNCSATAHGEELLQGSRALMELECTYHSHLVQTLDKWSSKIQAVAPSVLLPSNRNAFSRTTQHIKSAPQLIDETVADHNKVLARTRIYRGKGSRLGVDTTDEDGTGGKEDAEVFDDTDFYHQLLRDIIDSRGNGTGGNDDWVAMQKERKARKKVDTKASKGRKLRYEVHEKIQNFMAPVPTAGSWHEEQIDELFASLLGKGFENVVEDVETVEEGVELGDFRVFGIRAQRRRRRSDTSLDQLESPPTLVLWQSQMDTFEDDNPFENDIERVPSETSSTSKVNISAPSSPPPNSARLLSPSKPLASPTSQRQPQQNYKSDFCCYRDRWLHSGEDAEILITDAQKTSLHSNTPYITYVIHAGTAEARHRYSEFESLRLNLVKLYPTLIIPPIPSKQTIGDYAAKQAKAKEDTVMISRRKRMLQTFLNRIARHPILSNEHVFHRFLEGEVSWTEVLNSPPLSMLPKNILKAPSHNPTDPQVSPAYAVLPNPTATHPLRNPDQRFIDSEVFTNKFVNHLSGPMEKVTRRTLKRWSETAQDYSELGAALNGFSLNESGALATATEKMGQAVDASYMSTTRLLQELEQNFSEPLHEYTQFATIIKKLLAYRHQKHVQYEMTQDGLEGKRELLEEYEKSEKEAKRLEEALSRGRANGPSNPPSEGQSSENPDDSASVYIPPHPGPSPYKRRAPGMGLLNALSYTLHGMMDVDPETARRNGIGKTRETISQLEDALHLTAQDLKYSSSTIQADLDRFQRQKVADLREMTINMARSHRDWCKKNLEAWQAAKKEIEKIPEHPNSTPSSQHAPSSPPNLRRDSGATINGR